MAGPQPGTVFIVDDDPLLRRDLTRLLAAKGYGVESYPRGEPLLQRSPPDHPACVLLDVAVPGCFGLKVQSRLTHWQPPPPVVFTAANASVTLAVQAMKSGAVDFIVKPGHWREILSAVERALARSERDWIRARVDDQLRDRLQRLTGRELTVFALIADGLPNKHAAAHLGITEKTVKVHRSRVMRKLEVGSLAGLVRLAVRLEIIRAG